MVGPTNSFISRAGKNTIQFVHLTLQADLKDQMTLKLTTTSLIGKNIS